MRGTGIRCARHPGARAAWRCPRCDAALCPGCAYATGPEGDPLVACCACGAAAEPLRRHRAEVASYWTRLKGAPQFLLRRSTLFSAAAAAVVTAGLSYAGFLGALLAFGVYWGFLFAVLRSTSRGRAEIEVADFSDPFDDVVLPAIRGAVATAVLWVPAVVYVGAVFASAPGTPLLDLAGDPVLWMLLVASAIYAPMAVMIAASGGGLLSMLNPLAVAVAIRRLGTPYLLAVFVVFDVALASLGFFAMGGWIRSLPVPLVTRWAADLVQMLPFVLMSHVLGLLLYVHGDRVELGMEADYWEPVEPGAKPRGAPPRPAETKPVAPPTVDAEIGRAVAARDVPAALAIYRRYGAGEAALKPEQHFELARLAAGAGEDALATAALHAAAAVEADPVAPRALLALGRVYAQRLKDPARAAEAFRRLVERYPGTPSAEAARAHLEGR